MSPVATSASGGSTGHPATVAALVVVIVVLFIGLIAISIFIVRRRTRNRQSDGVRPLRMGRPQLINGGDDRFVVVYDDAKEKEKMSLPLETSGGGGGGGDELAFMASLPYSSSSSYGADSTFYPAPPPKAVVAAHHKKKHILSNLSPFKAAPRVIISSPKRVERPQVSVSVAEKTDETWSQIDLQTPGGLHSFTNTSNTTLTTIPEEKRGARALRSPGSTKILAVPPSYSRTSGGNNNGQQLPPVITMTPATPPVISMLTDVAEGLEGFRH